MTTATDTRESLSAALKTSTAEAHDKAEHSVFMDDLLAGKLSVADFIALQEQSRLFYSALEDAAMICGAGPLEVKWRVTLPAIRLGMFAAAIFSFLISWDEVVLSIFMASPSLQTLPVLIWSTLRQDLTPVIAAASTLLVAFTVVLMLLASLLKKGSRQ